MPKPKKRQSNLGKITQRFKQHEEGFWIALLIAVILFKGWLFWSWVLSRLKILSATCTKTMKVGDAVAFQRGVTYT